MADELVKITLPDGNLIDSPRGSEQDYRTALRDLYPEIDNAQFIQNETGESVEFRRVAAHKGA
jgi:hypothetical protein